MLLAIISGWHDYLYYNKFNDLARSILRQILLTAISSRMHSAIWTKSRSNFKASQTFTIISWIS